MIKGAKMTLEQRQKLSEARLGVHYSPKSEFKKGLTPWNKGLKGSQIAWNKGKKGTHFSSATQFKKGIIPWNKGKTDVYSEETRQAISEASKGNKSHLGHKHSLEARKKMSEALIGKFVGEKGSNWKGGITSANKLARVSYKYFAWQTAVFHRDNYTCQICHDYGSYMHADHIKSFADYPKLRYDIDNGRTLCRSCHYYITFKRKMPSASKWGMRKGIA